MSETYKFSIACVKYLNCAKGQAATEWAILEADESPNIIILKLQELSIEAEGRLPLSPGSYFFTTKKKG